MRLDAAACFDRRLERGGERPIAVAVSGGADSLLALTLTAAWAKDHHRTVLALSVDHGLQTDSHRWTIQAGEAAARLGCGFRALRWDEAKPAKGLPAAARRARHRLLADAARQAGAKVIVTGHTGDDALENAVLGQGPLYEWSPSPVWPEGRGLCLLRPLLTARRLAIRERLTAEGWTWVDDPANASLAHPRIAARRQIGSRGAPPDAPDLADVAHLARSAEVSGEAIRLSRLALRQAGPFARRRVTAAAGLCLGGGEAPPRGDRLDRLIERLVGEMAFTATLAGAKIIADGSSVLFVRNAGEAARGGLAPVTLPGVWDGRYDLTGEGEVIALHGHARSLPEPQRRALAKLTAAVRPGLPLARHKDGVTCPVLANAAGTACEALVPGRFLTACGVYAHETELK